jgi:molybdopterin-synthase adenylyltransferase
MNDNIINLIRQTASENKFPDNMPYSALSVAHVAHIAEKTNTSARYIELAALDNNIIPERYARNRNSLTIGDQITLLNKSVCIVGLGGLGGTVTEILARMGVGKLLLIDGDVFEDSNLNRQLLSTVDTMGKSKALTAAKRVRQINPAVETVCYTDFLTDDNADRLIGRHDVFVDCLDNLRTRFILEGISAKAGVPMVSGAVAGSTGQVTTIFPGDPGLCRIYGDPQTLPEKGVETTLGTLPYAVSLVATLECAEVSKVLLDTGTPLRNKLLIINPLENLFEVMRLS